MKACVIQWFEVFCCLLLAACGDAALADIVFAVSPSSSTQDTNKALDFYKGVVQGLNINNGNVRISMVPKECPPIPEIDMQNYNSKDAVSTMAVWKSPL